MERVKSSNPRRRLLFNKCLIRGYKADIEIKPKIRCYGTRSSIFSKVEKGDIEAVNNFLQSRKFLVDSSDLLGRSLLHVASIKGDEKMVQLLLQYNPQFYAFDYRGMTSIHYAAEKGHLKIFKLLVKSCKVGNKSTSINIRTTGEDKIVPLHYASSKGYLKIIKYILMNGGKVILERNDSTTSPLHLSVFHGRIGCVRELLKHIQDIDNMEKYKGLLHVAVHGCLYKSRKNEAKKNMKNNEVIQRKYMKIIDDLLKRTTSFLAKYIYTDIYKHPLMIATKHNFELLGKRLLEHCIKFNANYLNGLPVLTIAAKRGSPKFITELIEAGADISLRSSVGRLPIHEMVIGKNYRILSKLMKAGVDINEKADNGRTILNYFQFRTQNAFFLYTILNYKFDIHIIGQSGQTGLHTLCGTRCCNRVEYLSIFIERFLNFNVVNEQGLTPLEKAMHVHLRSSGSYHSLIEFTIKAMANMQTKRTFTLSKANINIISNGYPKLYHKLCMVELQLLKLLYVRGNITFFDLINKPLTTLREISGKVELMEIINSDVCDSFPIYGAFIKFRMSFAYTFQKLFETCIKILRQISLPHSALFLSFLNINELEELSSLYE